jgi:hypothetical protein
MKESSDSDKIRLIMERARIPAEKIKSLIIDARLDDDDITSFITIPGEIKADHCPHLLTSTEVDNISREALLLKKESEKAKGGGGKRRKRRSRAKRTNKKRKSNKKNKSKKNKSKRRRR